MRCVLALHALAALRASVNPSPPSTIASHSRYSHFGPRCADGGHYWKLTYD